MVAAHVAHAEAHAGGAVDDLASPIPEEEAAPADTPSLGAQPAPPAHSPVPPRTPQRGRAWEAQRGHMGAPVHNRSKTWGTWLESARDWPGDLSSLTPAQVGLAFMNLTYFAYPALLCPVVLPELLLRLLPWSMTVLIRGLSDLLCLRKTASPKPWILCLIVPCTLCLSGPIILWCAVLYGGVHVPLPLCAPFPLCALHFPLQALRRRTRSVLMELNWPESWDGGPGQSPWENGRFVPAIAEGPTDAVNPMPMQPARLQPALSPGSPQSQPCSPSFQQPGSQRVQSLSGGGGGRRAPMGVPGIGLPARGPWTASAPVTPVPLPPAWGLGNNRDAANHIPAITDAMKELLDLSSSMASAGSPIQPLPSTAPSPCSPMQDPPSDLPATPTRSGTPLSAPPSASTSVTPTSDSPHNPNLQPPSAAHLPAPAADAAIPMLLSPAPSPPSALPVPATPSPRLRPTASAPTSACGEGGGGGGDIGPSQASIAAGRMAAALCRGPHSLQDVPHELRCFWEVRHERARGAECRVRSGGHACVALSLSLPFLCLCFFVVPNMTPAPLRPLQSSTVPTASAWLHGKCNGKNVGCWVIQQCIRVSNCV